MTEKIVVITTDLKISTREIEVENGSMLKGLQEIVGGGIEVVHPRRMERPLCFVCNDEGLRLGLPINAVGSHLYGTDQHGHPIVGDIAIMREGFRNGEWDLVGFPSLLAEELMVRFTRTYPILKGAKPDAADS